MSEMDRESIESGQPSLTAPQPADPPSPLPPAPPAAAPANNSLGHRIASIVVLVAVVAAAGGAGIGWSLARGISPHPPQISLPAPIQAVNPDTGSGAGAQNGSLNAAAIAAKVDPAIVDINTVTVSGEAAGTGMILTSSGEVLTNNHVINGATKIQVTIAGRSGTYAAEVVGVHLSADVALLQIRGVSGLPVVTMARSSSLHVGDKVVALGNALGLGGTPHATQGTITALDQTITAGEGRAASETLTGMIQSDASISQGDSGGPLVNAAGQVIGMITAGDVQGFRSTSSTVAYAVPSDAALASVNKIRSGQSGSGFIIGPVGFLGVQVRDLDGSIAARLGLNVPSGALVVGVQPGSPAAAAGIGQYSVITAVGGAAVISIDTLGTALHAHKPGERLPVTWVDQNGTHTATVTLIAGPAI